MRATKAGDWIASKMCATDGKIAVIVAKTSATAGKTAATGANRSAIGAKIVATVSGTKGCVRCALRKTT
jgi:hypothetical protein